MDRIDKRPLTPTTKKENLSRARGIIPQCTYYVCGRRNARYHPFAAARARRPLRPHDFSFNLRSPSRKEFNYDVLNYQAAATASYV